MRIFRELFTANPDRSREEKRNDFGTVRLVVEGLSTRWFIDPQLLAAFGEEQIFHRYTREISSHRGPLIFGTKEALDTDSMPITRTAWISCSCSY